MFRSRLAEATLIGCLTALASFCALNARAGETYSIVAQSTRSSAATGRRPLAERIAAANLPIITQTTAATERAPSRANAAARMEAPAASENMAVAAVRVDQEIEQATPAPPPQPAVTPPVLWPFGTKKTVTAAQQPSTAKQPMAAGKATVSTSRQATAAVKAPTTTGREVQRQASARSSGKGLSSSSPASVTR